MDITTDHDKGQGFAALEMTQFKLRRFTYTIPDVGGITWDINRAMAEVDAGQVLATLEVPRDQLESIREKNSWDPGVVAKADPSQPGIGAPIVHEGRVIYVLIDGTHRAVRALQDGVPFMACLLTDEAARRCVLRGDDALLPW